MTKEDIAQAVAHLVEQQSDDYFRVLDYCVGVAAENRCGVRVTYYPNGDVTIMPTNTVKYGTIEEKRERAL